nr:hypothetical protein [Massilia sp. YIM B02763]
MASEALADGHRLVGTVRGSEAKRAFEELAPGRAFASILDVTDVEAIDDPVREARAEKSGKQPGDPVKAARAMLSIIGHDDPPVHLLLGSDALQLVRGKLASLAQELDRWEGLTVSTDG